MTFLRPGRGHGLHLFGISMLVSFVCSLQPLRRSARTAMNWMDTRRFAFIHAFIILSTFPHELNGYTHHHIPVRSPGLGRHQIPIFSSLHVSKTKTTLGAPRFAWGTPSPSWCCGGRCNFMCILFIFSFLQEGAFLWLAVLAQGGTRITQSCAVR